MTVTQFPPHDSADEDGLLAIGGDLEPESLLLAYHNGIFPWPFNEELLAWFSPPQRALIYTDEFHLSRSLAKELKRTNYQYRFNHAFERVVDACAEPTNRKGSKKTWITKDLKKGYLNLYKASHAYSYECYDKEELIAGVYGVVIGNFISAESMFFRQANASKLTLFHLIEYCKAFGISWIDLQVINPFTESIGAREIERDVFLSLLEESLSKSSGNIQAALAAKR